MGNWADGELGAEWMGWRGVDGELGGWGIGGGVDGMARSGWGIGWRGDPGGMSKTPLSFSLLVWHFGLFSFFSFCLKFFGEGGGRRRREGKAGDFWLREISVECLQLRKILEGFKIILIFSVAWFVGLTPNFAHVCPLSWSTNVVSRTFRLYHIKKPFSIF
jgi:hypothetical protein